MSSTVGDMLAGSDTADTDTSVSSNSSLLVDRVVAMRKQERTVYSYRNYYQSVEQSYETDIRENTSWRDKICQWTYSVVDHFDLSRETVAVSLSLFDRYLATQGNRCNGKSALLTSLTTLHIAIKLNEPRKRIKLSTLANLSRGQFGPGHIEQMELRLLKALSWRVNPPTDVTFVSYLLQFIAPHVYPSVRRDLFELSRYQCELSVCDSYFVEFDASTLAYASILNVIEDMSYSRLSAATRQRFARNLSEQIQLHHLAPDVLAARDRMRSMFASSMKLYAQEGGILAPSGGSDRLDKQEEQQQPLSVHGYGNRSRAGSCDNSIGSRSRFSASSARSRRGAPSPAFRNRCASSPITAGVQ